MKYVRVVTDTTGPDGAYGILDGETVLFLDRCPLAGNAARTGVTARTADIRRYLPPVDPPNVIALGLNYRDHAAESRMELPPAPIIFLKATTAVTGHLQPVVIPAEAPACVDYEAELTVVIGRTARNVAEKDALSHVFGYTCGNDVSARDCQLKLDKQWARGKSFDTFAPIGPAIATGIDPSRLRVRSVLNGVVMQEASTADLIFDVPATVSYLSRQMTLLPGTIIMTGTPSGVGFARTPPVYMKPGDTVTVEIEGIGALTNTLVKEER